MPNHKFSRLTAISVLTLILFVSILFSGCNSQDKEIVDMEKPLEEIETEEIIEEEEVIKEETSEQLAEEEIVSDKSDYLTVTDVEKVSGVQGIQLVDYDPSIGAGGDINFALPDGTMFLLAQIQPDSLFEEWRERDGFFHELIANLGDEAYSGPGLFEYQYIVYCLKKPYAVAVSSFFNDSGDGKPYFNQEQLIDLVEIILSRM